jgi:hypothetical protein
MNQKVSQELFSGAVDMRLPQAGEMWTPKNHNLNVPVYGIDPKGRQQVNVKIGQPIRIVSVLSPPSNDPEPTLHMRIEVKGITCDVWMGIVYIEPLA